MALGFFTGDNSPESYEAIQRRRQIADALLAQSQSSAPIQSWTQGAAKLVQALSGTIQNNRLDARERETSKSFNDALLKALGGGAPSPVTPSTAMTSADAGAAPKPASFSGSQGDFIKAMLPHAMKVSEATGLDPRLVIAQSALETGYGRSAPGNNFFGIKSHGQSGGNTLPTTEVVNGQPVRENASFRAYGDMGQSAADYAAFLKANPRYKDVLGAQGLDAQIAAMARSGYATDPMYGNKLRQIAAGIQLPQSQPTQVASLDGLPPGPVPSGQPMAYAPPQNAPQAAPGMMNGASPIVPSEGFAPRPAPAQAAIAQAAPPMPPPRPQGLGDAPAPNAVPAGPAPMQPPPQAAPPQAAPAPTPQARGIAPAGLLQLALDPRFSPQQRQMAMQMFQMQQQQANRNPMVIPEGATIYDPRTGRMTQPSGPKMSDAERQYQAAVRGGFQGSFFDYQQQLRRAGASSVNVNQKSEASYDQTMGKSLAEDHRSLITAGREATGKIAKYEALKSALDKTYTGAGGQTVLQLKRFAKSIGMDKVMGMNVDDVGDAEFANALGNQLALELRNPSGGAGMPGAMSDKDREFLVASIANIDKTPEGNKRLIDMMIRVERRNQEVAKLANDYARRNNGRLDAAFFDELAQWSAQTPLFSLNSGAGGSPSSGGGVTNAQAATDPAGVLQSARDAIARGAPRDAVLKRLQENGIDPAGL